MNKKAMLATVCTIVAFGIGVSIIQSVENSEKYSKIFFVDATFYQDKKIIEIKYNDTSQKTKLVILEILGMKQSFQRTFTDSTFSIQVPFDSVPQYGWKVMPITLVVEHEEFGKVGIKTDIHNRNEPQSNLIFSKL
jgi:hypothetical protein